MINPSIELDVKYSRHISSLSPDSKLCPMETLYPFLKAMDSMPLIACEKKLFAISHTTTPIDWLLLSLRLWAFLLGLKLTFFACSRTRFLVLTLISWLSLNDLETVEMDSPRSLAMSFKVVLVSFTV